MSTTQRDRGPDFRPAAVLGLLVDITIAARMIAANLNNGHFVRILGLAQEAELFSDEDIASWFGDIRAPDVVGWRNGRYLPTKERQRAILDFIADEADLQARCYMPRVS